MMDEALSQAIFALRLIERALHDPRPMEARFGDLTVAVRREARDAALVLLADFPAHCHLVRPEPVVYLVMDGEIVGAREIEHPGDSAFEVEWRFSLTAPAKV